MARFQCQKSGLMTLAKPSKPGNDIEFSKCIGLIKRFLSNPKSTSSLAILVKSALEACS